MLRDAAGAAPQHGVPFWIGFASKTEPALEKNPLTNQKLQPGIGFRWGDFQDFGGHHVLGHERIGVHSALQVRQ